MPEHRFQHPIEVRYGDLDPQGHVNNAKYLTYFEQARIAYINQLGLWQGESFLDLGVILAEARITFLAPILYGQRIQVEVWVSRLGNKSLTMEHRIIDKADQKELAVGSTVLVTYIYHQSKSVPIPERWRQIIASFEHLDPIAHSL